MPAQYQPIGLHTANMPFAAGEFRSPDPSFVRPFITIAQQIGVECPALPRRLAATLNERGSCDPNWSCWDQELVEKAALESQIPSEIIAALDSTGHSWIDDVLSGIPGRPDELIVLHRLRDTVRGVARAGNAILVGHGSNFITHDLPGGLHVRLIAPTKLRIKNLAARLNLSPDKAARHMRRFDRRRRAFFHRFWPNRPLGPEIFAAIFNVAELDEGAIMRAIGAILPQKSPNAQGAIQ